MSSLSALHIKQRMSTILVLFTKALVMNTHQYQKPSHIHTVHHLRMFAQMFVLYSHTMFLSSALISALSLAKCHSVSIMFCCLTKKSNLRWKRYFTSKTLRLTGSVFFIALVLSNLVFFSLLFLFFGCSVIQCSMMEFFCTHREGCKLISSVCGKVETV